MMRRTNSGGEQLPLYAPHDSSRAGKRSGEVTPVKIRKGFREILEILEDTPIEVMEKKGIKFKKGPSGTVECYWSSFDPEIREDLDDRGITPPEDWERLQHIRTSKKPALMYENVRYAEEIPGYLNWRIVTFRLSNNTIKAVGKVKRGEICEFRVLEDPNTNIPPDFFKKKPR
ncbi:MAG TPA: hypothetical protein VJH75_03265 [Patescibacteria group bacterium]|nr:hypothetical protein [Patescibacteria group bacterium]